MLKILIIDNFNFSFNLRNDIIDNFLIYLAYFKVRITKDLNYSSYNNIKVNIS